MGFFCFNSCCPVAQCVRCGAPSCTFLYCRSQKAKTCTSQNPLQPECDFTLANLIQARFGIRKWSGDLSSAAAYEIFRWNVQFQNRLPAPKSFSQALLSRKRKLWQCGSICVQFKNRSGDSAFCHNFGYSNVGPDHHQNPRSFKSCFKKNLDTLGKTNSLSWS